MGVYFSTLVLLLYTKNEKIKIDDKKIIYFKLKMAQENLIIGLKTNCAKGYNLAEFLGKCYQKSLRLLLKSWKFIEDKEKVSELAWEAVGHCSYYQLIDSFRIGILSRIGTMIIPESTYTNKKGITKTIPEQIVPAHYTKQGTYIGRVTALGDKPISYKMYLEITPEHFKFLKLDYKLEDCFGIKNEIWKDCNVKTKEAPKADIKEGVKK